MKDAYFFSHDSNARNDQKILALRMKYNGGMRGYGVYFGIIEIMRESNAYQLPRVYATLSFDLREPEDVIKDVVENFELFVLKEKYFYSESLKRRMEHLEDVRVKRAEAGRKGGLQKHSNSLANAKQMPSSKVKESKAKEIHTDVIEFLSYFNLKTKKSLSLTAEREKLIESRLRTHSLIDLKKAVDNFSLDTWEDRPKFTDIVYCIGTRNKIDNLDKWMNSKPKTAEWVKP